MKIKKEIWKIIPSRNDYAVSNLGRIKKIIASGRYPAGYIPSYRLKQGYVICEAGRVHCLVLEAFIGPKPEGMECRHLNGIRHDNRLFNLKWGTKKENAADTIRHGNAKNLFQKGHPLYKKNFKHSEESKNKMSIAHRGKKLPEKTKIKMSESMRQSWIRRKILKADRD